MPAIAITDSGYMFGALQFAIASQKKVYNQQMPAN